MNKKIIFTAIVMVFLVVIINPVYAEDACSSNYQCEPWSDCENGLKTRTCIDVNCGKKDVVERGFCENPDCVPKIECDPISDCTYTDKTDDFFAGEIAFEGYRVERCKDKEGCIASFLREIPCQDNFELQLSPIEVCGETKLQVRELSSKKPIATIDFNSWVKNGKFNLAFVQGGIPKYCPHCYNAVLDEEKGETGIDCGGPCTLCQPERRYLSYLAILFLWSGSTVFTLLSLRQYFVARKPQGLFIDEQ
ncbi:MAG: hypothetical protein KKD18_01740 [Nanoarchaeota archaeon]|nr:hypothetical protein [Nanoarchaeota archaeon]MBU0977116.1 hypothetical protein [Nanoarchaeota archaeon]